MKKSFLKFRIISITTIVLVALFCSSCGFYGRVFIEPKENIQENNNVNN